MSGGRGTVDVTCTRCGRTVTLTQTPDYGVDFVCQQCKTSGQVVRFYETTRGEVERSAAAGETVGGFVDGLGEPVAVQWYDASVEGLCAHGLRPGDGEQPGHPWHYWHATAPTCVAANPDHCRRIHSDEEQP